MSVISQTVAAIKAHAERVGLRELARQSEVPYSTLRSFAERGWTNKSFEALDKLAAAVETAPGAS